MPATPSLPHPRIPTAPYTLGPDDSPDLGLADELPDMMDCLQAALAQLTLAKAAFATDTVTENGAPAFATTQSPTLDLFFQLVRNCSPEDIRTLVAKAWLHSPEDTMRILLHCRDIRHGKGERLVVHHALMWIRRNKPSTYLMNLLQFIEVGYYKDLLLWCEMAEEQKQPKLSNKAMIELEMLAEQLASDYRKLQSSDQGSKTSISLAAKWAPSEKRKYDTYAKRIAGLMFPSTPAAPRQNSLVQYRKVLVKLRAHLVLVETQLAAKQFDQIDFARVPSKAHNRLKRAFAKHQPERYAQYLEDVKSGKKEIKSTGLQPHELVKQYLDSYGGGSTDDTIEMQWKEMVDKIRRNGSLSKSISIVDVSGSMSGTPMEVAIALGLLTSELTTGPFQNQVITFSATPALFHLTGDTLLNRVTEISRMDWGTNTNLIAVFNLLIQKAMEEKLTADQMPETLFIYSDMQFDEAQGVRQGPRGYGYESASDIDSVENGSNQDETDDWVVVPVPEKLPLDDSTFGLIRQMYKKKGYKVPRVVFWNLRATVDKFPVRQNELGVALVSGFSEQLLKMFLEDPTDMNPISMMHLALEPYKVVIADCDR